MRETRILVVDDEPAIRESVVYALRRDGFATREAATLREASAGWEDADFVILDLMLPDGSGVDFLVRVRARSSIPILVLTSRDAETDRVVGLELGADDYVSKPFSPREIVARVRAILRRATGAAPTPSDDPVLGPGGLRLDRGRREAALGDRPLALSRTEFDLLAAFLDAPGLVLTRSQLLDRAWSESVVGERTVDAHVKALRRKLEGAGGSPGLLETVRGVGYRLRDEPVEA